MFEIDAILEGQLSRRHIEDILREAQQEQFARDAEAAQKPDKPSSPLRIVLVTIIHIIWRG